MVGVNVPIRRGEVWTANLNPNKGSEVGKIRPVLVLQDTALTQAGLATIIVAPLTTQSRPTLAPLRVALPVRERMLLPSFVMVEHVRAIDRDRLGDGPLLHLDAQELAQVDTSLRAVLGLW
ncbi:MAG: MazF family transcriptional regulator [Thiomonas sp. 15-66-11]|jgi:mRNA interferase MazF|nr:MAG: MazF family transcriptional regulator [Thiomonas sp. 15-66-11]